MARRGLTARRARSAFWEATDRLTMFCLQWGGLVFGLVSAYLLYGLLAGSLSRAGLMTGADLQRVLQNVQMACTALLVSGGALILAGSIRFYLDDGIGYVLLVVGAGLHWGMPMLVGSSLMDVEKIAAATLPSYVAKQYSLLGTIALITAMPFMVFSLIRKLREARDRARRPAVVLKESDYEDEAVPSGWLCIFCWQMPYCRSYLRRYCQAFERRRSCWRIKSGCYCDEEMILRMMKRSPTSKALTTDQEYAWMSGAFSTKELTSAQKRKRCRECAIYQDHQRQKYQIMGPLVFPATVFLVYVYYRPIHAVLHQALEATDKFAARLSYGPQSSAADWMTTSAGSGTVEWLFLGCLALAFITYVLHALEYAIFDLQI